MFGQANLERDRAPKAPAKPTGAALQKISLADVPRVHPVSRFADLYATLAQGALLPHEDDVFRSDEMAEIFPWTTHIEPIEIDGLVDFKVLRHGEKRAVREGRVYSDQWMSETVDPEFVESRYRELVAVSILRTPMYSKGATPTREKAFLYQLRGAFPVFAENKARLRLFQIEAEPYAVL